MSEEKTGLILPSEIVTKRKGKSGQIVLNLIALDAWIDSAPDDELGVLVADGVPILDMIGGQIKKRALERMESDGQEVLTIGDGREVKRIVPNKYSFDVENMKAIQKQFGKEGKTELPDVKALYSKRMFLELTPSVLKALKITAKRLKELGANVGEEPVKIAGAQIGNRLVKQGKEGGKMMAAEISRARSDGTPKLETKGEKTANPERFEKVTAGIKPEKNPWAGDE